MPQVSEYLELLIIYIPLLDVFVISYLCTLINYTLSGGMVLQKSYALVSLPFCFCIHIYECRASKILIVYLVTCAKVNPLVFRSILVEADDAASL